MLWKTEGKRRRGQQRMRWLDSIINSMKMNLSKLLEIVKDKEAWHDAVHGVTNGWTRLSNWTTTNLCILHPKVTTSLGIKVLHHNYFSRKALAAVPPSDTENLWPARQHFLSREPQGADFWCFLLSAFCQDFVVTLILKFKNVVRRCTVRISFHLSCSKHEPFKTHRSSLLLRKMLFDRVLVTALLHLFLVSSQLPTLSGWKQNPSYAASLGTGASCFTLHPKCLSPSVLHVTAVNSHDLHFIPTASHTDFN